MSDPKHSLTPDYFDRVYAEKPDPWDFATSRYEAKKYERTMATLPRACYANAFEIGCSIGVLTKLLATRCRHLLSVDVSLAALKQARTRCADMPNVEFQRMGVPGEYPQRTFDLTIVSEVGYYLSLSDLTKLADLIRRHATPAGQLLLTHWLPRVEDYPLTGDQVHDYFLSLPGWHCTTTFRAPQYRIELLVRIETAGEDS